MESWWELRRVTYNLRIYYAIESIAAAAAAVNFKCIMCSGDGDARPGVMVQQK